MSSQSERTSSPGKEDLLQEMKYLDNSEIIAIISIGDSRLSHLKVQKIALVLADKLKKDISSTAYKFGPFSEQLMEKLQSSSQDFIQHADESYFLTDKGRSAYGILRDAFAKRGETDVLFLADTLRKMREDHLLALVYYLYPEFASESEIKRQVARQIKALEHALPPTLRLNKSNHTLEVLQASELAVKSPT